MESAYLPDSARHFDSLPDSARIDIATMIAVVGRSRASVYRYIDKGILPRPRKLAGTQNSWIVGEVRKALAAKN
ncbi:MAG: AlpA family phage regulatory protein [Azoarcus sp.]|nr:AlpA family phage regulatory protein [Azoarcus sp.]